MMHLLMFTFQFGALVLGYTHAIPELSSLRSQAGSSESFWQPSNNDIYIDDEELQGSGHSQGEVKDALEESSGSGAGPWPANVKGDRDDEDDEDGGSSSSFKPQLKLTRKPNLEHQKPNITVGVEQPSTGRNNGPSTPKTDVDKQPSDAGVIMNIKDIDVRTTSFFAQPGILEAFIGGAVVGLLCAILVVMFIVYRMRKKDEGSYALDELKRLPTVNSTRKTQTVNSSPESSPKFSNTVAL